MSVKKFVPLFIAMLCFPLFCNAGMKENTDTVSARRAFAELPSGFLDLISRDTRLDMLDYYDNDSIYKAPNNLNGQSYLEKITPDFLQVSVTPSSSLQLKVLDRKDGAQIVMALYTTGDTQGSRDTEIAFFDSHLQPLAKENFFPKLNIADFFDTKGYKTGIKEIEEILPFHAYFFTAAPGSDELKGKITYDEIITVEDARIIDLLVKPEVTFRWDGKKFKKI